MKSSQGAFGLILILILFLLVGCGGGESTATKQHKSESATAESVFDPMVQAIDKAKTVEDLSADRTRELDKELEKSQ